MTALDGAGPAIAKQPGRYLSSRRRRRQLLWILVFLLPQTILFVVFTMYPIVMNFIYSAFDWPGYGPLENFVGLDNFRDVLGDDLFWRSVRNTTLFALGEVVIQLPLALLMALILNDRMLKGAAFYRVAYFIPVVTTTAIVGVMMTWMFGAYQGVVNTIFTEFGLLDQPVDWLGNPRFALSTVILVSVWHTFGVKMVYWLAGLQTIPSELYEAAQIDGAGWWKSLRYITLPLLTNVAIVIVLISVKGALHAFDLIITMTNGGPDFATQTVDVYIYRYAFAGTFGDFRVGYAAAVSVIFGLAVMAVTLLIAALRRRASR
jgi:ABC-type sugar transport system permease subunit